MASSVLVKSATKDINNIIKKNKLSNRELTEILEFILRNYDIEITDELASKFYHNIGSKLVKQIHKLVINQGELNVTKPKELKDLLELSKTLIDYSQPVKEEKLILNDHDRDIFDYIETSFKEK